MIAALSTYSKRRVAYESTTLDRVVVVTYRMSANRSNLLSGCSLEYDRSCNARQRCYATRYTRQLSKLDNKTLNRDRRVARILSKSTRSTRSYSYRIWKREGKSFWSFSSRKKQKPYRSSAAVKLKNQGVNKKSTYLRMFERQLRFLYLRGFTRRSV